MQLKVESINQPKIVPSYSFYHPWAETVVCRTKVVEIGGLLERETVAGLFNTLWSFFSVFFPYRATEYSVLNLNVIDDGQVDKLAFAHTPLNGNEIKLVFNLFYHTRLIDAVNSLVHVMAHELAGSRSGNDLRFFRTFLAMVTLLKCQNLDLRDFNLNHSDFLDLVVSKVARPL